MLALSDDVADRLGWNPWKALRERPHLVFKRTRLPAGLGGAVYWPRGARAVVLVDSSLNRVDRNAALAHELCHDELPGASEARVCDEVARRLVPTAELQAMYEIAVLNDLPMDPWQIAEHFDVPDHVAERAMRLLLIARSVA